MASLNYHDLVTVVVILSLRFVIMITYGDSSWPVVYNIKCYIQDEAFFLCGLLLYRKKLGEMKIDLLI